MAARYALPSQAPQGSIFNNLAGPGDPGFVSGADQMAMQQNAANAAAYQMQPVLNANPNRFNSMGGELGQRATAWNTDHPITAGTNSPDPLTRELAIRNAAASEDKAGLLHDFPSNPYSQGSSLIGNQATVGGQSYPVNPDNFNLDTFAKQKQDAFNATNAAQSQALENGTAAVALHKVASDPRFINATPEEKAAIYGMVAPGRSYTKDSLASQVAQHASLADKPLTYNEFLQAQAQIPQDNKGQDAASKQMIEYAKATGISSASDVLNSYDPKTGTYTVSEVPGPDGIPKVKQHAGEKVSPEVVAKLRQLNSQASALTGNQSIDSLAAIIKANRAGTTAAQPTQPITGGLTQQEHDIRASLLAKQNLPSGGGLPVNASDNPVGGSYLSNRNLQTNLGETGMHTLDAGLAINNGINNAPTAYANMWRWTGNNVANAGRSYMNLAGRTLGVNQGANMYPYTTPNYTPISDPGNFTPLQSNVGDPQQYMQDKATVSAIRNAAVHRITRR